MDHKSRYDTGREFYKRAKINRIFFTPPGTPCGPDNNNNRQPD